MRAEAEIRADIAKEEKCKADYYAQYPNGTDGRGGFYCGYNLNMLTAELAECLQITEDAIEQAREVLDKTEGETEQDTEFVDIPDQFLLPCNMSGSPTMGKKPFAYLFNEKGLKWLEPLLTCSKEHKEWRMEEGRSRAKSWWKRQARALAKLKQVVVDEEARLRAR